MSSALKEGRLNWEILAAAIIVVAGMYFFTPKPVRGADK